MDKIYDTQRCNNKIYIFFSYDMTSINKTHLWRYVSSCYYVFLIVTCFFLLYTPFAYATFLEEGGFFIGKTSAKNEIFYNDEKIIVDDDGSFFIGFHANEPYLKQHYIVKKPNGDTSEHALEIKDRLYDVQRITGIEKKYVSPPPEVLKRIKRDAAKVKSKRKHYSRLPYYKDSFIWPIEGIITGVFGTQRFYNDIPKSPHYGIDIAGKSGAVVKAPNSGNVLLSENLYYSGYTIIIDHGHGVMSSVLHLKKTLVKEGEKVIKGQPIGLLGTTGRSTGPHVDWRINWLHKRLDAAFFVPEMPLIKDR